jgi:hypothetical protein
MRAGGVCRAGGSTGEEEVEVVAAVRVQPRRRACAVAEPEIHLRSGGCALRRAGGTGQDGRGGAVAEPSQGRTSATAAEAGRKGGSAT